MSELVLRSKYTAETHTVRVNAHRNGDFGVRVSVPDTQVTGLTLSADDTRKLRDFLNKELGEQAPKPVGTGPWVYLDEDSRGEYFWCQFPTMEKARDYAKFRTGVGMKNQMIARCHQTLVPVTVTTTSYEWKDL